MNMTKDLTISKSLRRKAPIVNRPLSKTLKRLRVNRTDASSKAKTAYLKLTCGSMYNEKEPEKLTL
jgi:hypothetical protein